MKKNYAGILMQDTDAWAQGGRDGYFENMESIGLSDGWMWGMSCMWGMREPRMPSGVFAGAIGRMVFPSSEPRDGWWGSLGEDQELGFDQVELELSFSYTSTRRWEGGG